MVLFSTSIIMMCMPCLTSAQVTDVAPLAETEASHAARNWLALVDAGKWDESWDAMGDAIKSLNYVRGWRWSSEKVRAPLGAVVSRVLIGDEDTPAPPHGYHVIRFRTVFANGTAVETLSLDRERTGWFDRERAKWTVVGISIGK